MSLHIVCLTYLWALRNRHLRVIFFANRHFRWLMMLSLLLLADDVVIVVAG